MVIGTGEREVVVTKPLRQMKPLPHESEHPRKLSEGSDLENSQCGFPGEPRV